MKVIIFQIQEYHCALRVEEVSELLPMAKLWKAPGMPASMEGLLNLGGKVIPVFRMDRIFKVKEIRLGLYTPILILKSERGPLGLIIEKAISVRVVDPKMVAPIKDSFVANQCVEAEITIDDQKVALIDVKKILVNEEFEKAKATQTLLEIQSQQEALLKSLAA